MKNKIFSFFLALMAGTVLSHAAVVKGVCGDNLTWSLNTQDSTLTIEGTGEMTSTPWSDYAMYVKYVSLPEGLTYIASNAFSNCVILSVDIPNTVEGIGSSAFRYCRQLTSVTLPNNLTNIAIWTFANCSALKTIQLPASISNIAKEAFLECTSLSSIVIPDGVKTINASTFSGCSSLQSVTIPNSVTTIEAYAFSSCSKLSAIALPENLTAIADHTFISCSNLSSIVIGDKVESIGAYAFDGCKLNSIVIPDNVTSIGERAFAGCTKLSEVTLGAGITDITNIFYNCNINRLHCKAVTPPTGVLNSYITNTACVLFVPAESVSTYASTVWWEDFLAIYPIGVQFRVEFLDWDGALLKADSVGYEESATAPADPVRNGYTFTGWDKEFDVITADLAVTAQYTINYRVEFRDWDGTLLKVDSVMSGNRATAPADPVREGYTFVGWSLKFNEVTSNLVVTARYMDGETSSFASLNFEITRETTAVPEGYVYSSANKPTIKTQNGITCMIISDGGASVVPNFNDPAEPIGGKRWMAFSPEHDCSAIFYILSNKKKFYIQNKEGEFFAYTNTANQIEEVEVTGFKKGEWYALCGYSSQIYIQKAEFYPTCTATEQRLQLKADKTEIFVDDEVTFSTEGGNGAIVIIDGTKGETIVNNKWIATAGMHTFIATQEDKDGICGNVLELTLTAVDNSPVTSAVITGESIVEVNQRTTLTCSAPNATSFQWYMNGVQISGATDSTYTFTPSEEGELRFVCEATNKFTESPVKSEVFKVLVAEAEPTPEPQSCGLLAKVQATSYSTASLTGTFTGTPSVKLQSTASSEYGDYTGYKLSSAGTHLGITFDEEYTLQAGDKVTVFVTTTSPKMQIFADKEGTTLLAETETVVEGENVFYLDERANGAQGIYVCRVLSGTEGAQYNAFVAYIAVERACVEEGYYQVIFKDWDGSILSSETVASGAAATAPKDPVREGYTFTGWDKDFSAVTEAMTITAQYQINTYTVDFVDWDDTVLKSEKVNFNESATAPKDPSREWYTFIGWDQDFSAVKSNMTVRALYSEGQTNMYTVRFTSSTNNSEISTGSVWIEMPVPPTFEGFTFLRWEMKAGELVDVIEIQAVYEANEPTSAPEVYTNPANPAQKLIRNGNVYILKNDKTYTITGQAVR